jgi:arylsulfatase A-like enzyme
VKTSGYCTDVFFNEAQKWIAKIKDKQPFFVYLPTNAAHAPRQSQAVDQIKYHGKVDQNLAKFYGMISNIDDNVGRLMARLNEFGLDRNTLVIFMNDNGGQPDSCEFYNAGLKGHKGEAWEGGTRAISLWHWPAVFKPSTPSQLTAHIDVFPTLAELAGANLNEKMKNQIEGRSLVPVLNNPQATWADRFLITHVGRWGNMKPGAAPTKYEGCSVRNTRYSLVRGVRKWELYDMEKDSSQKMDISESHQYVVKNMSKIYDDWCGKMQDYLVNEEAYKTAPKINPYKEAYQRQIKDK